MSGVRRLIGWKETVLSVITSIDVSLALEKELGGGSGSGHPLTDQIRSLPLLEEISPPSSELWYDACMSTGHCTENQRWGRNVKGMGASQDGVEGRHV